MRILFYTEDLSVPYDEGIKKTALYILKEIQKKHTVKGICKWNTGLVADNPALTIKNTNRLLLNLSLYQIIHDFRPEIILYLPSSSGTFASFLRMKVLSLYFNKAKTIMINLQPKPLNIFEKIIVGCIKPSLSLTPSPRIIEQHSALKIKTRLFPLFVDNQQFTPINDHNEKVFLRKKYLLPSDKFIITHIGHLNYGRNLESLIPLQGEGRQVIIVGSSSTPMDAPKEEDLKRKLQKSGILIFDGYIDHIEEIYRLSDLYVFPVINERGCIGMPLSILEARACGIPVLTTKYGSIQDFLSDDYLGIYYAKPEEFVNRVEEIRNKSIVDYSRTNINNINNEFSGILFKSFEIHE